MKSFTAPVTGFLLLCAGILSSVAFAAPVESTLRKSVNLARVVEVVNLVKTPALLVNLSVVDLGGSTHSSPTKALFLNLYSKGEMFSTDAVFTLGRFYDMRGARRTAAGLLQVDVMNMSETGLKAQRLTIDARQAAVDVQAVRCEDGMDCEASAEFASTIDVSIR